MKLMKQFREFACVEGDRTAVWAEDRSLSYQQLNEESDRLAAWIDDTCGQDYGPVIVYGHKSASMPVCFLACAKSGRAYCPVDLGLPHSRVEEIRRLVDPKLILVTEGWEGPEGWEDPEGLIGGTGRSAAEAERNGGDGTVPTDGISGLVVAGPDRIREIGVTYERRISPERAVKEEELFYIIFTSGSTGAPKGVGVTCECLDHYLEWAVDLGWNRTWKNGRVFLNQAPFSFDLSVMDTYCCLACGGTLRLLDHETLSDYSKLMPFLAESQTGVWVSTPSFAEICLADRSFCQERLPKLKLFLFCGETLMPSTVLKLTERFPGAKIVNTYGPTEATVAVTQVEITEELARETLTQTGGQLPVGRVKPGSRIEIRKPDGSLAAEGEEGEIVILGDTVAAGYFRNEMLTKRSFFQGHREGERERGYRTGDLGMLAGGMLYCRGRLDSQVKLHGYRIELGDVEANLSGLPGILRAVVVPNIRAGAIRSLTAYVEAGRRRENERESVLRLKKELRLRLPDYMIPKKIVFVDQIPITANGKADRRQLEELAR